MPWPVTLDECKQDTNITTDTNDEELQGIIDAATAILENHPGYTVADHVKQTTVSEWHDGGNDEIILKRYPVASVTSVTEWNGTTPQTLTADAWDSGAGADYGYALDADAGVLYRSSGGSPSRFTGRVKVIYVAGTTTVPADLRLAALLLVEHLWETQRGGQGPALPTGLDIDSAPPFSSTFTLPNRVLEILTPYAKAPAVA